MTANKKEKNLRANNIVHIVEAFILTAAAVLLSVISSAPFIDLISLLCTVTASALFVCALFLLNPAVIIVSGIASFAITFAVNGDVISAGASMIYVVIGTIIYFGVRRKKTRTQITVRIACVLAVIYAALLILSFMSETGAFSISAAVSAIDGGLTNGVESLINQYNTMFSQYAGETDAVQAAYIGADTAKDIAANLKAVIPAFFVLYTALIAYLSTALFKSAYNIFIPMANPGRKRIKNKYWRINISSVSAIIMITAIIFSFILAEEPFPAAVLKNLMYILAPGFCIMGIYCAYDKIFKSGAGLFPVIMIVSAIMLIFLLPFAAAIGMYIVMTVLMAAGLYSALIDDIKKVLEKAKTYMFGDDDDDDDDYID